MLMGAVLLSREARWSFGMLHWRPAGFAVDNSRVETWWETNTKFIDAVRESNFLVMGVVREVRLILVEGGLVLVML